MKMKEKNAHDPSVDGRIGLEVRVVNHTLHVLHIHLNCEICNTKNENMNCLQGVLRLALKGLVEASKSLQ